MNIEIKHLWLHKCPKKWNQYTLIALVITIIVLLILAGVTVVTLTGDNGLLQKANTAKQTHDEAAALEKIKAEVAGSYNLEGKIDLNQLKTNLKHLNIPDEDIIPTIKDEKETFPVITKINNYKYDILENGNIDEHVNFSGLESSYGKVINGYTGYSATDVTEWKLLYVDEKNREVFLISSNTVAKPQPTENGIPLASNSGVTYTGSNNIASFEYGKKYNSLWLNNLEAESTNNNAKATAYLCDPSNFEKYKTEKAKYAAGGPTYEILIASFYNKQVSDFSNEDYTGDGAYIKNLNNIGYFAKSDTIFRITVKNGLYLPSNMHYWIASPVESTSHRSSSVMHIHGTAYCAFTTRYFDNNVGIRPVVCLPASAIEVVEEGENIVLNYKQ